MKDTFTIQDELFTKFSADSALLALLPCTTDEQKNARFRREFMDVSQVADAIPYVSIVFIDGNNTGNYLINKGVLEIEIYTDLRYNAMLIARRIKEIIELNYEFRTVKERQVSSGVQGVFCYCMRFLPLVKS